MSSSATTLATEISAAARGIAVPELNELLQWAAAAAAAPDLPVPRRSDERTWERLDAPAGWDAWVIAWPTGAATGWHDHEGAAGVFSVVRGVLTEFSLAGGSTAQVFGATAGTWSDVRTRRVEAGKGRVFGANHVHHVVNEFEVPALSIHVYAPKLQAMTRYRWDDDTLVRTDTEAAGDW